VHVRLGQVRSEYSGFLWLGQVSTGYFRLVPVRSGYVRLCQINAGKFRLVHVRSDYVRLVNVRPF